MASTSGARLSSGLRLLAALAVFVAGLVALLPQPTALVWQASVLLSELGYWLVLPALLLIVGWRKSWLDAIGGVVAFLGLVLLLVPVVQASRFNETLSGDLDEAFGVPHVGGATDSSPRSAPLVLADLVFGVGASDVLVDEHVYSVVDGESLTLDLYRPAYATGLLPGVIVIHGGGWTSGDKRDLAPLNSYLASRGYVVASISYRLAPRWPFPSAQADVDAALAYVKSLDHSHGVDPNRLALIGRSSGAQIALLSAYATPDPAIRGVVSYYGPTALRWGYHNPAKPGVVDSSGVLDIYLGGPPEVYGDRYDAAEPAQFVTETTPPTLFLQGLRDEHVSPFHAEFVSARLIDAGVPHYIVRMPWATHGCDYVFRGPCGQVTTFAVERFLAVVLSPVTEQP